MATRMRVLAFDIPGTGESAIPLAPDSTEMVDSLVAHARELGDGTVAHLGISMGGWFSAASGLAGSVDAAIVLGGPVESSFAAGRTFRFGMADIVANAFGFGSPPSEAEMEQRRTQMSLRPLLDQDINAPMLVINGADDVHVPQQDTLVFRGRRDTRVELLAGTGHCAVSKLGEAVQLMVDWLNETIGTAAVARAS
jgi:esterase FrsA